MCWKIQFLSAICRWNGIFCCWRCTVCVCPSVSTCFCVLTINNISAVEMDPLHLEVRPYIQSWAHWKKKSIRVHLSCISHSIVVLQWDLFSSGRFNTWAGQWKECNRVGWREEGWGWGERERERRALWAGKQEEIARRKEVTLIQNEHIPPVFCTSWISLLDIFKIIQLSEIGYSVSTKGWELLVFKCVPTWFKYEDVWKYSIAGATI